MKTLMIVLFIFACFLTFMSGWCYERLKLKILLIHLICLLLAVIAIILMIWKT